MFKWLRQQIRPKQQAEKFGTSIAQMWKDVKDKKEEGYPQPIRRGPRLTTFDDLEGDIYLIKLMAKRDNIPPEDLDRYIETKLAEEYRIAQLAQAGSRARRP